MGFVNKAFILLNGSSVCKPYVIHWYVKLLGFILRRYTLERKPEVIYYRDKTSFTLLAEENTVSFLSRYSLDYLKELCISDCQDCHYFYDFNNVFP